jgi:RNA polymerase sigma-54 factor
VLEVIQGFEPTRRERTRVAECLALQLRERGRLDPAIHTLLKHLDLVARRDIAMLCTVCGVDAEDVADMIAEIRTLTPKPGLALVANRRSRSYRMCLCAKAPTAPGRVELNSDTLPRLLVNSVTMVAAPQ